MVANLSHVTLQGIEEQQRERLERLARKADHFIAEPDPVKPGGWIVRNPKVPYRIELVNALGRCTCRQYRMWDRCKHSALVMSGEERS